LFTRLYSEGDGDCGICFEYAVHEAIVNKNPEVLERIDDALVKHCKIKEGVPTSILFGAEKKGVMQLIGSKSEHLTDESWLLPGTVGSPIKLKKHIQGVINAFHKPGEREKLPNSINGLWKADLFVGKTEPNKWVGTTVKSNESDLESAKGLRLAIIPSKFGKSDRIRINDSKNLVICPMPYNRSFIEIFYEGWNIIKAFINAKGKMPKDNIMPNGLHKIVCKELVARNRFTVLEVIEALEVLKQPKLISAEEIIVQVESKNDIKLNKIIAPSSLMIDY
jgi:hypothetical protein